jgi:hypothetical protein
MKTISLRGIDDETAARLKEQARKENLSVNALILRLIRRGIGLAPGSPRHQRHQELDALAGTWSRDEAAQFLESIRDFEAVDEDLWRETDPAGH